MIKAMECGTGSISTTHAATRRPASASSSHARWRPAPHVTHELATTKLAECLDLIVQVRRKVERLPDGTQVLRRWVSEVVLVEPGEKEKGYALTDVFGPSEQDRPRPAASSASGAPICSSTVSTGTSTRRKLTDAGGDHDRPTAACHPRGGHRRRTDRDAPGATGQA